MVIPENSYWIVVIPSNIDTDRLVVNEYAWYEVPFRELFLITNERQALDYFYQICGLDNTDVTWTFEKMTDDLIKVNPSKEDFNEYWLYRIPIGFSKSFPALGM